MNNTATWCCLTFDGSAFFLKNSSTCIGKLCKEVSSYLLQHAVDLREKCSNVFKSMELCFSTTEKKSKLMKRDRKMLPASLKDRCLLNLQAANATW